MKWVGVLDRYVWRVTLGSFVVCLSFITGVFVLSHFLVNVDRFVSNIEGDPLGFVRIIEYYLALSPTIFVTVAPFVTVAAGMFAVSRLMGSNELVPMLFTGRSLKRVLAPLFVLAILMAVAMALTRELVIPSVYTLKDDLEHELTSKPGDKKYDERVIEADAVDIARRQVAHFSRYFVTSRRIEGLRLYDWTKPDQRRIILAQTAVWRENGPKGTGWYLVGGQDLFVRQYSAEPIDFLSGKDYPGFHPLRLRRLIREQRDLVDHSYSDLAALVADSPEIPEYTVALHSHMAFPLANLLLLLLALPFALRFERGSRTERVFFALVICAGYLIVDLIFRNLGNTGYMHPVVAAWFPTVLFGSLGVVMFDTVRT